MTDLQQHPARLFRSLLQSFEKAASDVRKTSSQNQWLTFLGPQAGKAIVGISTPETERPRDHFTLRDLRVLTKDEFVQFIRDSGTSSALLFVHGFDTSFEDAIFQLAQITWDTQYAGVPIAFSWPSKGNIDPLKHPDQALLAYNYDKDSARYSQGAFLDVLHLLQTSAHVSKVYIVAHSMGNQIVVNSIDQANYRGEEHLLTEVILAAPDVDWDTFKLSGQCS
jgi:esterase/lipase superfamily enzyme